MATFLEFLGFMAVLFGGSFSIAYYLASGHWPRRRRRLHGYASYWSSADWRLKGRKAATLCPCCSCRTRSHCTAERHSWVLTRSFRWVFLRCWHCDFRKRVGTRKHIVSIEDALRSLDVIDRVEDQRQAAREFEEYRRKLLKRYG